jgi:predicted RNase H-like nuclease
MKTPEDWRVGGRNRFAKPREASIRPGARSLNYSQSAAARIRKEMRFVGIDLGWSGAPSGFAVMELESERLRLTGLSRLETHADVIAAVPQGPCYLALDAPVLIRNQSGMRAADRLAHSLFARQKAGAYPVNLGMPFAAKVLALVNALTERGFRTGLPPVPREEGRRVFEVYPNAAMVRLFGLAEIVPYKKGRLEERRPALGAFRELLGSGLRARKPSFHGPLLPPVLGNGPALKAVEDQMDAVLCAYVAAHFWWWGLARNNILGDDRDGFIVNPSF